MPCLAAMPHVREAYDRLHAQGFEVLSISLDQDKEALQNYITSKQIPWPQCFNAEFQLAETYGIGPIPEMWLVDKKGVVRDQIARFGLQKKVEKLLAE